MAWPSLQDTSDGERNSGGDDDEDEDEEEKEYYDFDDEEEDEGTVEQGNILGSGNYGRLEYGIE